MIIVVNKASDYKAVEKTLEGRPHLVVPVVMLVPGVHEGSAGKILHSSDEYGKNARAWDGMPVTLNHPQNDKGEYVSARNPEMIELYTIGRIFNTKLVDNKLKAEAWIDMWRLRDMSGVAYKSLTDSESMDVSTGLFSDNEDSSGVWNGEPYTAIARNYQPDHLALLPGGKGACSWDDGCGIRVNNKKEERKKMRKSKEFLNKVSALIANTSTRFCETDREWLMAQEEGTLDLITPLCASSKEADAGGAAEVTREVALKVLSEGCKTIDDWVKVLPDAYQKTISEGVKMYEAHRTERIAKVLANTKDVWTEGDLISMSDEVLEKVYLSVEKRVGETPAQGNYSANAGGGQGTAEPEPLMPSFYKRKE